jgi:MFS family permease
VAGTTTAPLVAAGLSLTAATWFGVHPSARLVEPSARAALEAAAPASAPDRAAEPTGLSWFSVPGGLYTVILLIGAFALGNVFGGTQAGVTAFTAEVGRPGAAGLVYALLGTGSAAAGLASAALPARFGHSRRLLVFGAGLAALAVPLLVVGSLAWLCVAMVLFGCAVAPFLISLYALAERTVTLDRAATVMTLLASAVVVGYATGSSTAGVLGDNGGHRSAFLVPVAAGMLALVTALAGRARLSRLDVRSAGQAPIAGPSTVPGADTVGG